LGATYVDADGASHPAVMGCYGIGVSRTLQSAVEQQHDDNGIVWPISIAPYQVEIAVLNIQHPESMEIARTLTLELEAAGIEVLVDDRAERPGVKFKDADLVGIPVRVGIGERSLKEGQLEIKLRRDDGVEKVPVADAVAEVRKRVDMLRAEVAVEG
jgi:prolyl-tRNA synthetase